MSWLKHNARVTIKNLKNKDGEKVIDGNLAYKAILDHYDTRAMLVEQAWDRIRRACLEPTGDLGTHLVVLQNTF